MTIGTLQNITYHTGAQFSSLWYGLEDAGAHGQMSDAAGIRQSRGDTAGLRIRIIARLVDDDLIE